MAKGSSAEAGSSTSIGVAGWSATAGAEAAGAWARAFIALPPSTRVNPRLKHGAVGIEGHCRMGFFLAIKPFMDRIIGDSIGSIGQKRRTALIWGVAAVIAWPPRAVSATVCR